MSHDVSEGAKSRWDRAFQTDHADQAHICKIYTLASVLYWQLYGNKCFSNTGSEYGWLAWLKRIYGSPRPKRVLELGSGNGDLLLDLRRMDFANEFVGIDISEAAIHIAREKARQAGYTNLTFIQEDLNHVQLEPNTYDIVISQMCIHHVENLEGLFGQVARALTPGGVFAINEYVGPARWQFTLTQLILANLLLQILPRRLRVCYPDGRLKRGIRRPTIQQMIDMDPSEAARSDEILPVFQQYFVLEHCIDYGGSVSILVLDNIVSNFREDDPQSIRWFKFILDVDHWARQSGLVPIINVVLAGRPRV